MCARGRYLAMCRQYPVSSLVIREHIARFWWRPLMRFPEIRRDLAEAYTLRSFEVIVDELASLLAAPDLKVGEAAGMVSLGSCQSALVPVPATPSDRALARWHRFEGDRNQAEHAEATRHAMRSADPLEDLSLEWEPVLSRKKAKKYVAVSRSHLRSMKRKATVKRDERAGSPEAGSAEAASEIASTAGERPAKAAKTSRGPHRDRKAERQRMVEAQQPGSGALRVAVDMGMADHQSTKELNKLANQVRRL